MDIEERIRLYRRQRFEKLNKFERLKNSEKLKIYIASITNLQNLFDEKINLEVEKRKKELYLQYWEYSPDAAEKLGLGASFYLKEEDIKNHPFYSSNRSQRFNGWSGENPYYFRLITDPDFQPEHEPITELEPEVQAYHNFSRGGLGNLRAIIASETNAFNKFVDYMYGFFEKDILGGLEAIEEKIKQVNNEITSLKKEIDNLNSKIETIKQSRILQKQAEQTQAAIAEQNRETIKEAQNNQKKLDEGKTDYTIPILLVLSGVVLLALSGNKKTIIKTEI